MQVSISHLPSLNETFTVTASARAAKGDEDDAELFINVSGGVYLAGEDRWHGPLKLGESKTIQATFAMVIEGNHNITAIAYSQNGRRSISAPILVYLTETTSKWRAVATNCCVTLTVEGSTPEFVSIGRHEFTETALLLNDRLEPRIAVVTSADDIKALQRQGLIPEQLRYRWRKLSRLDFSKQMALLYWDGRQDSRGSFVKLEDDLFQITGDGTLSAGYGSYTVPQTQALERVPVSAVDVRVLSWDAKVRGSDRFVFDEIGTIRIDRGDAPSAEVVLPFNRNSRPVSIEP